MEGTNQVDRSRELRRDSSEPERVLWSHLRARRLDGIKFRRQVPIGPYIVDFYSHASRVAVEVDGAQHADRQGHDDARSSWLRDRGIRVVRFSTADVLRRASWVLDVIDTA